MTRGTPSKADQALIAYAAAHGLVITASKLERWRTAGLLPRNQRTHGGPGSASTPAAEAPELVVWLARHTAVGRRPHDLAILAFGEGLPVPESTVRSAFTAAIDAMTLDAEGKIDRRNYPDDESWAEAVAGQVVGTGEYPTLVPQRIRNIDRAIEQLGTPWSSPAVAAFDKGTSGAPLTAADVFHNAVMTLLLGRAGTSDQQMADLVRVISPAGAPSPVASMIERDQLEHHDGLDPLTVIPEGDGREQLRKLLSTLALTDLAAAFRAQRARRAWAAEVCAETEAELTAGVVDGPAVSRWRAFIQLGLPRHLLVEATKDERPSPSSEALSALVLALLAVTVKDLDTRIPGMQWDLLPHLMPLWLLDLVRGWLDAGSKLHDAHEVRSSRGATQL